MIALGLAAAIPGPGVAVVIATTLEGGAVRALRFCLGVVIGDLIWLNLSLNGLAFIAVKIPTLFIIIKWIGILYLLMLSVRLWRSSSGEGIGSSKLISQNFPIASGFTVTMGNPKAMLFYISLLPSIFDTSLVTTKMILILSCTVVVILSLVLCLYVLIVLKVRYFLSNNQKSTTMNRLTSIVLAGSAAWIMIK